MPIKMPITTVLMDDAVFHVATGKVVGFQPQWVDIDFPIIIRTTGANIPTLETLQGNVTAPQWQVDDFNVCEGQELIHGWQEGTSLNWHAHVITNGTQGSSPAYLKWEIEWFWINVNGGISDTITTTSTDLAIPANTPTKTMLIQSIGTVALPTARVGGHIYTRLKRIAATGAAPAANPWCTMLQAHVLVDTLGSRSVQTK
jgi:hypothetical protein